MEERILFFKYKIINIKCLVYDLYYYNFSAHYKTFSNVYYPIL